MSPCPPKGRHSTGAHVERRPACRRWMAAPRTPASHGQSAMDGCSRSGYCCLGCSCWRIYLKGEQEAKCSAAEKKCESTEESKRARPRCHQRTVSIRQPSKCNGAVIRGEREERGESARHRVARTEEMHIAHRASFLRDENTTAPEARFQRMFAAATPATVATRVSTHQPSEMAL